MIECGWGPRRWAETERGGRLLGLLQLRLPHEALEEWVRLLELATRAHDLLFKQPPAEKHRVLQILLPNCTWVNGELRAEFGQPSDMLAVAATSHREKKAAGLASDDLSATWYPRQDSNLRHPV